MQENEQAQNPARSIARYLWACVTVTVIGLGCSEKNRYVEPPPPEVTVAQPVQQEVTHYLETTATAVPVQSVNIRARIRGFLKERLYEEGAMVKKDQLLLVIDEEPFQLKLEQAKARLAEGESALKKARQSQSREMMSAQLALDESQLLLAKSDEQRLSNLVASRAVSAKEVDQAVAARKKCEAQVELTKANLKQVESDYETAILGAEALVSAARSVVRDAEIELSYCRICSPIDGRVGRVLSDVGNLVGDGQATLLTTVVKVDPIYVYSNLSVDDFLKYRAAIRKTRGPATSSDPIAMELALANETDYPHRGHIDYHDPQVNKATSTVEVRGVFPNPDGTILPGMFARIRVPVSRQTDALLVPDRALGVDQQGQFVLVVTPEGQVAYRQVKTGPLQDGLRVVEGTVSVNDQIIVEGLLRARPGMKVSAKTESATVAKDAGPDTRRAAVEGSKKESVH